VRKAGLYRFFRMFRKSQPTTRLSPAFLLKFKTAHQLFIRTHQLLTTRRKARSPMMTRGKKLVGSDEKLVRAELSAGFYGTSERGDKSQLFSQAFCR
jgi:hypothetical protein